MERFQQQARESGIESGIVNVGPFSPFPTRTKMRLKSLAAGRTHGEKSATGCAPVRPGRPRRTPPPSSRSVSSPNQPDRTAQPRLFLFFARTGQRFFTGRTNKQLGATNGHEFTPIRKRQAAEDKTAQQLGKKCKSKANSRHPAESAAKQNDRAARIIRYDKVQRAMS